jgi:hypothetical protein
MTSMPRSLRSRIWLFSSDARISSSLIETALFFALPMLEILRARNTRIAAGTVV